MRDEHMIDEEQYEKALSEKPKVNPHPPSTTAFYTAGYGQHFVQHVLRALEDEDLGIDLKKGGFTVYTNVDSELQRLAEKSVRHVVSINHDHKINQGCFMAMDHDGRILCEVGGISFAKTQYNIISQGHLQPGSGFKPFVYATALRDGVIGMNDYISNAPIRLPGSRPGTWWEPKNASPSENADSYSLVEAFARSVNRPAINTIIKTGPKTVAMTAKTSFGFVTPLDPVPPLALGSTAVSPLEMAEGYSVFMLRGDRVHPFPISKIVDADGTVVKEFEPQKAIGVFDPRVCDDIDTLLRAVVEHGTGTAALPVPNARGKTGTTNNAKDAWFTGYADGVLGVAWVGNQRIVKGQWKELSMSSSVYGGTTAAVIWADVMGRVRQKYMQHVQAPPPAAVAEKDDSVVPALHEQPEKSPPGINPDDFPAGVSNDSPGADKSPKPKKRPNETDSTPVTPPVQPDTIGNDPDDLGTIPASQVDKPKKKPRHEEETVEVEICADSGLRATQYCPETVTRTFPRSQAPKKFCRIHRPGD